MNKKYLPYIFFLSLISFQGCNLNEYDNDLTFLIKTVDSTDINLLKENPSQILKIGDALYASDDSISLMAMKVLGMLNEDSFPAIDALIYTMIYGSDTLRSAAAKTLEKIGEIAIDDLLELFEDGPTYRYRDYFPLLTGLQNFLICHDRKIEVREYAAMIIGKIGKFGDNIVQKFILASKDSAYYIGDYRIREAATKNLILAANQNSLAIEYLLYETNVNLLWLDEMLDGIDSLTIKYLVEMLKDEVLRGKIIKILTGVGLSSKNKAISIRELVKMLEDVDSPCWYEVCKALRNIGKPAGHLLIKALYDEKTRLGAAIVLGETYNYKTPILIKSLEEDLKSPKSNVRYRTALSLLIKSLEEALKSPKAIVRYTAALSLSNFGDKSKNAIPYLIAIISDSTDLGRCSGHSGSRRLYNRAKLGLSRIGSASIPLLIKGLQSSDKKVIKSCIDVLMFMGTKAWPAIGSLKTIITGDPEILALAKDAIDSISQKWKNKKVNPQMKSEL